MALAQDKISPGIPINELANIKKIQIHVTEKCNLRCTYCYNRGRTERTMPLATAEKILRWYVKASGANEKIGMRFMGGEPLVEFERMKEIVELAKKIMAAAGKTMEFHMTTNCTLFNEEIMEWAVENRVGMAVSADGNALIHDRHRLYEDGKGSWEDVKKALILRDKYFPGQNSIGATVMPDAVPLLYDSIKGLYEEVPVKFVKVMPNEMIEWDYKTFQMAKEQLLRLKSEGYKVFGRDKPYGEYSCSACVDRVIIGLDGAIMGCPRLDDLTDTRPWFEKPYVLGHIDYGITNLSLYRDYLEKPQRLNAKCQKCKLPCEGPCSSSCFTYSGNIFDFPAISCWWKQLCLELEGKI